MKIIVKQMQKVQSVIKVTIICLSILYVNLIQGQETIKGKYGYFGHYTGYNQDKKDQNIFIFSNNDKKNEFTYRRGSVYGKGTYTLENNKLILEYNKTKPIKIGYHISKMWLNKNKDSIAINLKVFDFDSIPIMATIRHKDSLPWWSYSKKMGASYTLNKEEKFVKFKRKKNDFEVFRISALEYRMYNFILDAQYNYDISVFLQKEREDFPILNQIDTLDVVKKSNKKIIIKNKDGTETIWDKVKY